MNLTDGLVHDLALYALDWNRLGRQELVQIIDAGTGQVLDTESLANFGGGVYLRWAVRGHVRIVVTNQGPVNAVISGLFLDPVTTAAFVGQDSTTQGTWIGAYGAQGYDVINAAASLPGYATVTPAGQNPFTAVASTTDVRALQVPVGGNRVVAGWHASQSFTVTVNLADGSVHDLELYFLDWARWGRVEQVRIADAATGAVLDTRTISSFGGGVYLDYVVSGKVLITITKQVGSNAVLNGLFFDGNATAATFLGQDATTQGTWIGAYGAQGYDVINAAASLPSYATVTPAGQTPFTAVASTTDVRALQVPVGGNRVVAGWHASQSFTVTVNLADGSVHDLELYFLDWARWGRVEQVRIADAATGAVLDTRTISSFGGGVYLDYVVSGDILITITTQVGANDVLNGLFLDRLKPSSQSPG